MINSYAVIDMASLGDLPADMRMEHSRVTGPGVFVLNEPSALIGNVQQFEAVLTDQFFLDHPSVVVGPRSMFYSNHFQDCAFTTASMAWQSSGHRIRIALAKLHYRLWLAFR